MCKYVSSRMLSSLTFLVWFKTQKSLVLPIFHLTPWVAHEKSGWGSCYPWSFFWNLDSLFDPLGALDFLIWYHFKKVTGSTKNLTWENRFWIYFIVWDVRQKRRRKNRINRTFSVRYSIFLLQFEIWKCVSCFIANEGFPLHFTQVWFVEWRSIMEALSCLN